MLPSPWPDRRRGGHQYAINLPGYVPFEAPHNLLLGLALRAATRDVARRVRSSILMRTTQIKCRERLASRFPPRLRRCLTTLPEDASTGETPQRLAKEASLLNLSGLSQARTRRVAAWCVPTPGKETSRGAAWITKRSSWTSSSVISSERVSWRRATKRSANLVAAPTSFGSPPGRKRAATATSSFVGSLRKRRRSSSGAVRSMALSRLAARTRAFTAERRALLSVRSISTRPSALLGTPAVSPASTALAAASASMGSDLPGGWRRRWRRLGLSTSTTGIPASFRWRVSLRPRSCRSLPHQHTLWGRSLPPNGGASRSLWQWWAP